MQYRRFGRTGLRVPIFSCGGMRFMYGVDLLQHKFGGRRLCSGYTTIGLLACGVPAAVGLAILVQRLAGSGGVVDLGVALPWWAVAAAGSVLYYAVLVTTYLNGNQANLQACLEASFAHGITHIETAKMYGTSEKQIGKAFAAIWTKGRWSRDDIILQTKVRPADNRETLLKHVEESFTKLRTDRIDLLSIHGVNNDEEADNALRCADWLQDLVKEGRVSHVGFSTHARTTKIVELINTNKFSYVNLHKHYFGSYSDLDNMPAVEAATALDMGVFIISPTDKGGKLQAPPPKLLEACAPLSPMLFNDLYLLTRVPGVSTLSLGAAEPGNFDEHLKAL